MVEAIKIEPRKYSKQFPSLAYLLGCYFHEDMFDVFDWEGRKPNYKEIVKHFKVRELPSKIEITQFELREFVNLSRDWDENKLDDVLSNDFSNRLFAPFFKVTYREFLESILEILEEPIEKTKNEFIPHLKPDAGWGDEGWKEYVDEETKQFLNIKT